MTAPQDKAIILRVPVADMNPGDTVIMRPKPAHPVPLTIPAVLAQASESGPLLLMEYDKDRIKREGFKVRYYAVAHYPLPRDICGVIE